MARCIMSVAVALGLLLTAAVGAPPAFAAKRKVAVTPVFQSSNCAGAGKAPAMQYFAAAGAARDWVVTQTQAPLSSTSAVYLPPDLVFVALSMGRKTSSGYGIAVARTAVLGEGGMLLLQVDWAAPDAGDDPLRMQTSPCALIGLPKHDYKSVRAVDQHGRVRLRVVPGDGRD